jgi:hypothetical protein
MKKEQIIIRPAEAKSYFLRHANQGDIERLRVWKNRHKHTFFYQQEISPEQQKVWYAAFAARNSDFMFMIVDSSPGGPAEVGSLGFRDLGDRVDIYNVMRGEPRRPGGVSVLEAMSLLVSYIAANFPKPITCMVLKDNPANDWYQKCGFYRKQAREDCYLLEVDLDKVEKREFRVES